jgi:hypothetical protein
MSAFINAKSAAYNNERRMTLEQCQTVASNFSDSFGITLDACKISNKRYELRHIRDDASERVMIQAESTTALYWSMVELRDVLYYARDEMKI